MLAIKGSIKIDLTFYAIVRCVYITLKCKGKSKKKKKCPQYCSMWTHFFELYDQISPHTKLRSSSSILVLNTKEQKSCETPFWSTVCSDNL